MTKKLFIPCILISLLFTGCTKEDSSPDTEKSENDNISVDFADVTLNNIKNELPLGNTSVSSTLDLLPKSIYTSKFINFDNSVIFNNNILNNQLSSLQLNEDDTDDITLTLNSTNINVLSEYSIQSLVTLDNYIYFINTSDGSSLYKYDPVDKASEKILEGNFYEITTDNNLLFLINKDNNHNLISFNTKTEETNTITLDNCGKYFINNNYVIYQNLSDKCKLYASNINGSSHIQLTDHAVDSFVSYNNNIIYVSGIDNSLYSLNLITNNTDKLLETYAKDLKIYGDSLFYIDHNNLNRLTEINIDFSLVNFDTNVLNKDSITEYYPTDIGIFYIKSISPNKINFFKY